MTLTRFENKYLINHVEVSGTTFHDAFREYVKQIAQADNISLFYKLKCIEYYYGGI